MTEQEARQLTFKIMTASSKNIDPVVMWTIERVVTSTFRIVYALGYQLESMLIGEDYEAQQKRDFPYILNSPGRCASSPRPNRRAGSTKQGKATQKSNKGDKKNG